VAQYDFLNVAQTPQRTLHACGAFRGLISLDSGWLLIMSNNQFAILIGVLVAIFFAVIGTRRRSPEEEADEKMRRIDRELKRERKAQERLKNDTTVKK
jgi:uncharacterized membrane protein